MISLIEVLRGFARGAGRNRKRANAQRASTREL
jgi:hypothetical protein